MPDILYKLTSATGEPLHGGKGMKAEAEVARLERRLATLESALQLIAAKRRSDGTWNRDREACQQLAEEALRAALAGKETSE